MGVKVAEQNFDSDPLDANLIAMSHTMAILNQALTVEEDYWKQKVVWKWVVDGERNRSIFILWLRKNEQKIKYIVSLGETRRFLIRNA